VDDSALRRMKTNSNIPNGEWCVKAICAWQLAVLRFAITMNDDDRLALLVVAAELDAPGSRPSTRPGFRFFYNTSTEILPRDYQPATFDQQRCPSKVSDANR